MADLGNLSCISIKRKMLCCWILFRDYVLGLRFGITFDMETFLMCSKQLFYSIRADIKGVSREGRAFGSMTIRKISPTMPELKKYVVILAHGLALYIHPLWV